MIRADRVMDLLELLRARDLCSVQMLADELKTSRRTILRDLATLRARGWPIRSDTGPGGGVYLDRDRGLRAVHLGLDEIIALWLAAQLSARSGTLPWSAASRSALDKILASVPDDRARTLRRLVRRVVIGPLATPRVLADLGQPPPELLTTLERAFAEDLCLTFSYVDRHGRRTRRTVEPHGLLVEHPAWYLLTRDRKRDAPRMFRMDRVRRPKVQDDAPFTPDFEGLKAEYLASRS
ncbi:MAG: WYL domain-containing protein [Deltaproteobacteria bacterium]|jgi:predicted DNA-binding transcriptional regulator YafY